MSMLDMFAGRAFGVRACMTAATEMNSVTLRSYCILRIRQSQDVLLPLHPRTRLKSGCIYRFCSFATRRNRKFAAWNSAMPIGYQIPMMKNCVSYAAKTDMVPPTV